jgi:hypothetical protein
VHKGLEQIAGGLLEHGQRFFCPLLYQRGQCSTGQQGELGFRAIGKAGADFSL